MMRSFCCFIEGGEGEGEPPVEEAAEVCLETCFSLSFIVEKYWCFEIMQEPVEEEAPPEEAAPEG